MTSETISDQVLNLSNESNALLNARTFLRHDSNPRAEQVLKMRSIFRNIVLDETWPQGSSPQRDEDDEHCAGHSVVMQSVKFLGKQLRLPGRSSNRLTNM